MDHYTLSDELRRQLLENAAWGKAGVAPRLDEASCESDDEKPAKKKKAKKARKDKEEDRDEEEEEEVEESAELDCEDHDEEDLEESEEVHVCPLCVSELSEAIEEDRIFEHLNVVMALVDRLSQLQEGEEDIEAVIASTVEDLLFQDEE